MTLDEIYRTASARLNKDRSGNIFNVKKLNLFLALVNIKLFNQKMGLPEEYGPGQPFPRQALDMVRVVSEDVMPFRVRFGGRNAQAVVENGFIELPSDFARNSVLTSTQNTARGVREIPIPIVLDSEWSVIAGSALTRPTEKSPISRLDGNAVEILPRSLKRLDWIYYRWPKVPYFDFITANDVEQYLAPGQLHDGTGELPAGIPSRSQEVEWPESVHDRFVNLLVEEASVMIRDQFTYQDAAQRKQTGT